MPGYRCRRLASGVWTRPPERAPRLALTVAPSVSAQPSPALPHEHWLSSRKRWPYVPALQLPELRTDAANLTVPQFPRLCHRSSIPRPQWVCGRNTRGQGRGRARSPRDENQNWSLTSRFRGLSACRAPTPPRGPTWSLGVPAGPATWFPW